MNAVTLGRSCLWPLGYSPLDRMNAVGSKGLFQCEQERANCSRLYLLDNRDSAFSEPRSQVFEGIVVVGESLDRWANRRTLRG